MKELGFTAVVTIIALLVFHAARTDLGCEHTDLGWALSIPSGLGWQRL
jgi:hypothetical protein